MKPIYYEQGDVLRIRISTEPIVNETSQGNLHVGFAADGSIAELVIQRAREQGLFKPEIKLPHPESDAMEAKVLDPSTKAVMDGQQSPRDLGAKSVYFEDNDILYVLLSDKPVLHERSQEPHTSVGYAADGSVVELFCMNARQRGLLPMEVAQAGLADEP